MPNINTKHYEIFNYWKDKYISKDGLIRDSKNREKSDKLVVCDWGEPSCWACGKVVDIRETKYLECLVNDDYEKIWNYAKTKSELIRCHIIPRTKGGTTNPENLFLMCPNCHQESPDTSNPRNFFRYVYRKRQKYDMGIPNVIELIKEIDSELKSRGQMDTITIVELLDINGGNVSYDEFYKYLKDNVASHCSSVVHSSMIMATADYLESKYEEMLTTSKNKRTAVCYNPSIRLDEIVKEKNKTGFSARMWNGGN